MSAPWVCRHAKFRELIWVSLFRDTQIIACGAWGSGVWGLLGLGPLRPPAGQSLEILGTVNPNIGPKVSIRGVLGYSLRIFYFLPLNGPQAWVYQKDLICVILTQNCVSLGMSAYDILNGNFFKCYCKGIECLAWSRTLSTLVMGGNHPMPPITSVYIGMSNQSSL